MAALLACTLGALACQKAGAPPPEPMAPAEPDMPDAAAPINTSPVDCDQVRAQARKIRENNCAGCHEAPAKSGNFNFVLDDETLMGAVSSTGQRFILPMQPDKSRLYQRVAAGEMPPVGAKLGPDDVATLRQWIMNCMMASTSPGTGGTGGSGGIGGTGGTGGTGMGGMGGAPAPDGGAGAGGSGAPDAGGPEAENEPEGCGDPGQPCCVANGCHDGGCCVLGQCRGNGQACGGTGATGLPEGLPGVCSNGSCGGGATACGNVAQPCCGDQGVCTASGASCQMGTSCEVCGGEGQACCGNGGSATCLPGMSCSFTGFGRPSSCVPCGGAGQPCCGNGSTGKKKCNQGLACHYIAGMGDRCGS
jgi:hypothetical protein